MPSTPSRSWRRRALAGFAHLPRGVRQWLVRLVVPSFSVGGLGVVERGDGRLLLVRHAYRPRWGLPGGFLQRGETPVEGARREILEEVGLEVDLLGEPSVVVAPRWRRVDVVFRARPSSEALADDVRPASVEIQEVGWFRRDALPELQEEAAEAMIALARVAGDSLRGDGRPTGRGPVPDERT
jgi:ADP-ribose pyrophosphatase YjhB (NUDIX family)